MTKNQIKFTTMFISVAVVLWLALNVVRSGLYPHAEFEMTATYEPVDNVLVKLPHYIVYDLVGECTRYTETVAQDQHTNDGRGVAVVYTDDTGNITTQYIYVLEHRVIGCEYTLSKSYMMFTFDANNPYIVYYQIDGKRELARQMYDRDTDLSQYHFDGVVSNEKHAIVASN